MEPLPILLSPSVSTTPRNELLIGRVKKARRLTLISSWGHASSVRCNTLHVKRLGETDFHITILKPHIVNNINKVPYFVYLALLLL